MKTQIIPPDCLNPSEFMWHVTTNTPRILAQVNGIVNVDAHLGIDAAGNVTVKSITCKTITGLQVAADEPEIVAAARVALAILRFAPARDNGNGVAFEDYPLSFGYTTAALEIPTTSAHRIKSQSFKN
jgi:hypothetical protein